MSLAFLVPLFLLGIAGIAIPVVVHLTRRQRRNVVEFPSLMFLSKVPFQEQRRRRIQHWLLLSLRALALLLLAVAFARPFLDRSDLVLGGAGGPRELVVLIDQSYSMGAGDQWTEARRAAAGAFDDLGPLDRASLVTFAQGARVIARSTSDRTRLRAALDTVDVGSGTTRYGPALKAAQTILEESDLPSGEVVLVSDFQRNGWSGDEGVRLPPGAVLTPVSVAGDVPENIQITGLGLARQSVSGRERVTPTVRLARVGGDEPREVPVTLELDGQEIQTRVAVLEPDGATALVFQPFTLSQPHTRGTVRVPADDLSPDDVRHFVLSPGSTISVLVVEGSRAPTDASFYLRRALEISEEGRFSVRVRRGDGVTPQDLENADVVVLNDVRVDGASAERLGAFARGGGGVLLVLGERSSWPESAADVAPGAVGPVDDRAEGQGGRLGFLEYGHPVFEPFAGPRSGDFTGARFFRARDLTLSDSARVMARFDDGSVALAETRTGRGTIMVWTSTMDAQWNDLALQPVYLPFVHRLAEYLSGRVEVQPWFTAGQIVDLADPDALEAAGLVSAEAAGLDNESDRMALSPSGAALPLPAGDGPSYLPLEEQGFYTVRLAGSDPDRPFVIAVNVDLSESTRTGIDPEELVAQITAPGTDPTTGPDFAEGSDLRREDQERRQSLWRLILAAAFALLVLETVLSNWVSRRRSGTPGMVTG
jgi:hypothetical protein